MTDSKVEAQALDDWIVAMVWLIDETKKGKLQWEATTNYDGSYRVTSGKLEIYIDWVPSIGIITFYIVGGACAIEHGAGGMLAMLYKEVVCQNIGRNMRQPPGSTHPQEVTVRFWAGFWSG